jgi:DUF4097 and DUF4098 domain-containing protein YvlB
MPRNHKPSIGRVALLSAALILTAVPLGAEPRAGRPFHWTGVLKAGQRLTVHGINGVIHAERTLGTDVVVDAEKRGRHDDPDRVEIQVEREADGVTICARYPRWWGSGLTDCDGIIDTKSDVTVDFTVKLPAGVEARFATVNGEIRALDLRSPLEARTVNGSVHLATSERAEARTVNGTIVARATPKGQGEMRFATVNGAVRLDLPRDTQADISAHTVNGDIRSDFPVTIHSGWVGQRLEGRIGRGGPEIRITTVNGSIELRSE